MEGIPQILLPCRQLPQFRLQNLARRVFGERGHDDDLFWRFIASQLAADEFVQILLINRLTLRRRDKSNGLFAPPRTQISPVSFAPRIFPSSLCTLISTFETGRPIDPALRIPLSGFFETTGLASLNPYPSISGTPNFFSNSSSVCSGNGALPLMKM